MAQAPNTTGQKGFLRSVGDGSNQSYWSLPIGVFTASQGTSSPQNTVPGTSTSIALSPPISVTVKGYSNYLVIASASFANADTGGSHDGYIRLALDGTLTGTAARASLDKYSGGDYYYQMLDLSTVISTDTGSHTIALWGQINGAGTAGKYDDAFLTVIGLP